MGVYIFTWDVLRKALVEDEEDPKSNNDFGKNIVPLLLEQGKKLCAYRFSGYWKDVGTISSLWESNMDILDRPHEINLIDRSWRIYSRNPVKPSQFLGDRIIQFIIIAFVIFIVIRVMNKAKDKLAKKQEEEKMKRA